MIPEATHPEALGVRFVRNVLWNFGGQVWSLILAFFSIPYIVHKLGTDAYGLLMTVGVVTNYLWFMDLGLGGASVKYIAEYAARDEWDEVRRVFWSSWIAYLLLGVLAAGVIVLITPLSVYRWFRIPIELQVPAVHVFYLSAIGFLVGMITQVPAAIPRALQRFDVVNRAGILIGSAQVVLTVALLALGYTVREVVAGNLAVAGLSLGAYVRIARCLLPRWGRPRFDVSAFRRLLGFGGWLTISGVAGPVLIHLEKIVLASQISTAAVAYYVVPYNIASRFSFVSGAFSAALFPLFSSLHGLGKRDMNADINLRVTRLIVLLLMPLVIFFIVFGQGFLHLWMGPEFARNSTNALRVLVLAMLVNAAAWSPYNMIQASGRPDLTAKFHMLELLVHVPLTLACVRFWGITGAAWAWFLRVSLDTVMIYGAAIRLYNLDWRVWIQMVYSPAVGAIVAGGAVVGILRRFFSVHWSPLVALMVFGGTFFAIVGLSVLRWGVRSDEYRVLARAFGWRQ